MNNGRSLRLHRRRVELKKRDPAGGISSGTAEPTHLPINSAEKKKRKSKKKANKVQVFQGYHLCLYFSEIQILIKAVVWVDLGLMVSF